MGSTSRLDPVEDYARLLMQQATARILENTGFAQAGERALTTLTDITRFMMQKLWIDAKQFAEHAGRKEPNFKDAHMVFENLQFNVTELHDYLQQTYSIPPKRKIPQFPVELKSSSSGLYDAVSERELADRSEDIPRYMPPIHPEWCSNTVSSSSSVPTTTSMCDTEKSNLEQTNIVISGNSNATVMHSAVLAKSDSNNDNNENSGLQANALNNRRGSRSSTSSTLKSKCRMAFPDFSGLTAKDLGLIRQKRTAISSFASGQNSEPSGISSSANISSAHVNSENINSDNNGTNSDNTSKINNNKDTTSSLNTTSTTLNTTKSKHRKTVNHIVNINNNNKDDNNTASNSSNNNNAEKLYQHQTKVSVAQQQEQQSVSTSNVNNNNNNNQPSTSHITSQEPLSMVRKEAVSSHLKMESDETQSENNFPIRRASGMFGMPPSAVVMHHHHTTISTGMGRMVSTASDSNLLRIAAMIGGGSDDGSSPVKTKKKKVKKVHDKEKKEKHKSKDKPHKDKRKQLGIGDVSSLNASCSSSLSSSCSVFGTNTTTSTYQQAQQYQSSSLTFTQSSPSLSSNTLITKPNASSSTSNLSRQQFQLHDDLPLSAALAAAAAAATAAGGGGEASSIAGTSMSRCWLDNATIPKNESIRLEVPKIVDEKPSRISMSSSSSGLITKFHVSSSKPKSPNSMSTNEVRRQTHSIKSTTSHFSEQESCSKKTISNIVAIGAISSNTASISSSSKKERKNNKRERGKPRIKSVAIVPSDDSSSDSGIQGGGAALSSISNNNTIKGGVISTVDNKNNNNNNNNSNNNADNNNDNNSNNNNCSTRKQLILPTDVNLLTNAVSTKQQPAGSQQAELSEAKDSFHRDGLVSEGLSHSTSIPSSAKVSSLLTPSSSSRLLLSSESSSKQKEERFQKKRKDEKNLSNVERVITSKVSNHIDGNENVQLREGDELLMVKDGDVGNGDSTAPTTKKKKPLDSSAPPSTSNFGTSLLVHSSNNANNNLNVSNSSDNSSTGSVVGSSRKRKSDRELGSGTVGRITGLGAGTKPGVDCGVAEADDIGHKRDKETKRKAGTQQDGRGRDGTAAASEEASGSARQSLNILKLKFHPSGNNLQQENSDVNSNNDDTNSNISKKRSSSANMIATSSTTTADSLKTTSDETPKITVKFSRTSDAQQHKDFNALCSSSKASEATLQQNQNDEKEKDSSKGDEIVSEAQLNSIEEALMGRLSPKTWGDNAEDEDDEAGTEKGRDDILVDSVSGDSGGGGGGGKEKPTTSNHIITSGGSGKKRKHKKEKDRDKYNAVGGSRERESISGEGAAINHEQQQHFHRHKEKKKEKERVRHRKDKRKERDSSQMAHDHAGSHSERHRHAMHGKQTNNNVTPPHIQSSEDDLKHSKKRLYTGDNQERERVDGEPLRKIPKLKIIIGGGTSSVQASPSSNSSPVSSPHINNSNNNNNNNSGSVSAVEQIKLKVKPIVTSQDSRCDSQSLSPGIAKSLTTNLQQHQQQQQKVVSNENNVDSNINMKSVDIKTQSTINNNDNSDTIDLNNKRNDERKEPKRPPCVTKAELKAIVKSSGEKKRPYSSLCSSVASASASVSTSTSASASQQPQQQQLSSSSSQSKSKRHEINDDNNETYPTTVKEKNRKIRSSSQGGQQESSSSRLITAEKSSDREVSREKEREEKQREKERVDVERERERPKESDVKEAKRFEKSVKKEEKEKHKQGKEKVKDERQKQRERDLEKERKKNGKTQFEKDSPKISSSSTKSSCVSSGVPKKEKDLEMGSLSSKSDKYISELKASAKKRKEKQPRECVTVENDDSPDKDVWICPECSVAYVDGATDMVGCDACDNWFHWSCVGLLVAPPVDVPWYCQSCAKKHAKRGSSSSNRSTPSGKRSRK